MRTFFVLTLFVLLSSCGKWQSFCCSKCNVQTKDSIYGWDTYSCDSFLVFIPNKEIKHDTTLNFDPSLHFHSETKKNGLTSTVDINSGKLSWLCAEDSLRLVIEVMKKTSHEKETNTKEIVKTEIICPWYVKPLIWWFCITFLIFVVWVVIKIIKIYSGKG